MKRGSRVDLPAVPLAGSSNLLCIAMNKQNKKNILAASFLALTVFTTAKVAETGSGLNIQQIKV